MAANLGCSLKACTLGPVTPSTGRVEVKGFEPPEKELPKMAVSWSITGEACFHGNCWRLLLKSAKGQKTETQEQTLSKTEKEIVLDAAKTAEYFDSVEKIDQEALRIAKMLMSASHAIAFTGAGISTAAGIGDFRGKSGKWTENDRAKIHGRGKHGRSKGYSHAALRPTYTHEALCKLVELGRIKFIISQNCDGLHRLSGIPRDRISELHGNTTHEKCEDCGARYERPQAVRSGAASSSVPPRRCPTCGHNHRTGRKCERKGCKGYLMNTIINFGDSLETEVLGRAESEANKNDFVLCLGSTLRVTPACDLVEMGNPVKLAICNRQPTPFDSVCTQPEVDGTSGSRVFGDCDDLMRRVMRHVMSADDVTEWEDGREDRMKKYDLQRT